jgi:polyhydroxybutyrate depolymerase
MNRKIKNMRLKLISLALFLLISKSILSQDQSTMVNLRESIIYEGTERTYILHLPAGKDQTKVYPLVIALHGGGGDGKGMQKLTLGIFDSLADKDGFLVLYPDGIEKHWNDGRSGDETGYGTGGNKIDDIGFLSELIDKMIKERSVDQTKVYITGMSNGAMMTYRCGCELSNKIAAIAPVAGNIPEKLSHSCKPVRPISVLVINSMADPLMPYKGGEVTGPFGMKKLGKVLSANESIAFWVKFDGCNDIPLLSDLPDKDPADGTRIKVASYTGGRNNSELILYSVEGGGHSWPGGYPYLGEWIIGRTSRDMDACEQIWEFFKRH